MKSPHRSRGFIAVALLLLLPGILHAQFTSWQWLNPYPQGNTLRGADVLDSSLMVAVGDRGTIVKSTDGGEYWRVKYQIGGLDTELSGVRFFNRFFGYTLNSGNTLLTTDGGESWSSTSLNLIDVARLPSGSLLALRADRVIIKTDDGESWYEAASVTDTGTASAIVPINDSLWLVSGARVLLTANRGLTWDTVYDGSVTSTYFFDADTGFITFPTWIAKTTNGGADWYPVFSLEPGGGLKGVKFSDSLNGTAYGWVWLMHGGHAGVIVGTNDGGETWVEQYEILDSDFLAGDCSNDRALYVGEAGLMVASTEGGGLVNQTEGEVHSIIDVSFGNATTGYMITHGPALLERGILFKSIDGGLSWDRLMSIEASPYSDLHFFDANHGCLVWDYAPWIIFTSDGGATWDRPNLEEPVGNDIFMATPDSVWIVGDSIMFSPDRGETWVKQADSVSLSAVQFITSSLGIAVGSEILVTTNAGLSWNSRQDSVGLNSVSFAGPMTGLTVGGGRVFYTADGGWTWTERFYSSPIELNSVKMLDEYSAVAIGGLSQLSYTLDAGLSWYGIDLPSSGNPNALALAFNNVAEILHSMGALKHQPLSKRAFEVSASTTPSIYMVGEGGTILVAGYSPLTVKTWTGLIDTAWNTDSNWSPIGKPLPGDSVVIPDVVNDPVIEQPQQQIVIASLSIRSGAKLTITNALSRFSVLADVIIHGTLEMRSPALTTIVVGKSWIVDPGGGLLKLMAAPMSDLGFVPSQSTVYLTGKGTATRNFYNLVFDTASTIQSSGSITVENQCLVLRDFDLRSQDTLDILNTLPQALIGSEKVLRGTIVRAIDSTTTQAYRYESNQTSVAFYLDTGQVRPARVAMRTMPDTPPTEFTLTGGWNILSVPYVVPDLRKSTLFPTSASPAHWFDPLTGYVTEDTLKYGRGYWLKFNAPETVSVYEEVPSVVDTATNVATADSVNKFSYWVVRIPRPTGSGTAISRVYEIGVGGTGLDYLGTLKFRYDQADVPEGLSEDSLRLVRYEERLVDTLPVSAGWNMIGSLGRQITPSMITSDPPGMVTSNFFGFDGVYYAADTLRPIFGYWVKTDQAGQLLLTWDTTGNLTGRIRVVPTNELPPEPPDGVSTMADLPREYQLEQSYPNPFNAEAIIRYGLPEESRVNLTVYNTLGQVVVMLSDGVEAPGYKIVRWDGLRASSGVYYYRLEATSTVDPTRTFTRTMKMAMVK